MEAVYRSFITRQVEPILDQNKIRTADDVSYSPESPPFLQYSPLDQSLLVNTFNVVLSLKNIKLFLKNQCCVVDLCLDFYFKM
jgi:hypothetical protein